MLSFRFFSRPLRRAMSTKATLETLNFDNLALKSLPIDPEEDNFIRQVPGACFSRVKPDPVKNPQLVACSPSAMALLDLGESELLRPELLEYFSGNKLLAGSEMAAHCYCGHQFGYFSGQLGDGAAKYLGEVVNKKGERWEVQIKGAGPTPYSRHADGRKVLRSTIREFLCSEAIHFLGIPSTRAGTCITSDSTVVRDIFYDGNPIHEKCSVVSRIAPTFLRFGSFEIFKPMAADTGRQGPSVGRNDILIQMLDYTIQTFYREIWDTHSSDKEKMYFEFWSEVVRRTARTVAEWQCVGWCHGVLNTDNMSILGLTIDYGPFGFIDRFQADYICNGSDDGGRYSYQKQPEMCKWNCKKFAEAIQGALPLVHTEPNLHRIFDDAYGSHYKHKMRKKFGLKKELPEDKELVSLFLKTMEQTGADFTNCFRCLSRLPLPSSSDFSEKLATVKNYLLSQCCTAEDLKKASSPRMDPSSNKRKDYHLELSIIGGECRSKAITELMKWGITTMGLTHEGLADTRQLQMFLQLMQTNPTVLPALGSRFAVIAQELERMEKMEELQDLTDAGKLEKDGELWDTWLDQYTGRLKQEEEGVEDLTRLGDERATTMNSNNPRFILRNYIAQNAITAAENGDFSEVQRVLKFLENPYTDDADLNYVDQVKADVSKATLDDAEAAGSSTSCQTRSESRSHISCYDGRPPDWARELRVT